MPRRSATLVAALLTVGAVGCAAPTPETSPTPRPDLAAVAAALPERAPEGVPDHLPTPASSVGAPTAATTAATTAPGAPSTAPSAPPTAPEPRSATSPEDGGPEPAAAATTFATVEDARGDHGLEGPAYADLVAAALTEDGDDLVIEVVVAAPLPARLAEGEVMGIGVDLLRDDAGESQYQVFIDAGSDGYRAYLQTPGGFVAFPGGLRLGTDRLVARLALSSLGTPLRGDWRVFVDWSEERVLLNAAASDRSPGSGWSSFDRS